MKAKVFTQDGETKGEMTLPKEIFSVEVSENLLHEALVRHLANKRQNIAKVKTRGEVSGGGRKPWRQKGTGRARQGSIRSPQWRGGGVVFGPTGVENFHKQMPRKMRRKAIFGALSKKAKDREILILEKFQVAKPSCKAFASLLAKLPVKRKVLLVLPERNSATEKSVANLQSTQPILVDFLNVHDILKFDQILFLQDSIEKAKNIFLKS